jgi:CBS domain containing-hemolysin-like protein
MYTTLIVFAVIAIAFSFMCSMWEAVLLSVTPSYAQIQLQQGSRIGLHLQHFKENVDRPLAAILTLNTIAHTVGAIGVGNQATIIWAEANPLITAVVIPVVMTLAILILSEIVPKTLGANYWRELTPFTVNSLLLIMKLLAPLVWLSQHITRALKKDKDKSVFSRTDFLAMTEIGAEQGVIEHGESRIISNLLKFDRVCARDIMTPRTVVHADSELTTIAAFHDANPTLRFSRIPIYEAQEKDHVIGYVLKHEVLAAMLRGEGEQPLSTLRRSIMVVKEDEPIPQVFERLMAEREHVAVVVDEFGGMAGVVTMEDVIETMLGLEIVDELDHTDDMQVLARRNWEHRARDLGLLPQSGAPPVSEPPADPDAR